MNLPQGAAAPPESVRLWLQIRGGLLAQQKLFLGSTPTHGIKMLYYTNPTLVLCQVHDPAGAWL